MSTPIIIGKYRVVRIPGYIDYNVEQGILDQSKRLKASRIRARLVYLSPFEVGMLLDEITEEEEIWRKEYVEKEFEKVRSVTTA